MAPSRFTSRKLGATLRALTFRRDDGASPYRGGYDIDFTYGRALPPSAEICYPISSYTRGGQAGYEGLVVDHRTPPYGSGGRGRFDMDALSGRIGKEEEDEKYGYGGGGGGTTLDAKPVYRGRKEEDEEGVPSWGYEYGYGGRRLRCQEDAKVPNFGEVNREGDFTNLKKKKEDKGKKKVSYGEDFGGAYGMGNVYGKRLEDEERIGGGFGRFQKPIFHATKPIQQGVPSWEPEYGYGGRRFKYEDESDLFKKKNYAQVSMDDFKGSDQYGNSENKYDYFEENKNKNKKKKKEKKNGCYREDAGSWQKPSLEAADQNHGYVNCKFIDDSEEEWMRKHGKRRT